MTSTMAGHALSVIALVVTLVALPALYVRAQTHGSMSRMMSGCGGMMGGGGERPNQQWRR